MSICEDCILYGRCSGSCDDTDSTFYAFERENDNYDLMIAEQDTANQEV